MDTSSDSGTSFRHKLLKFAHRKSLSISDLTSNLPQPGLPKSQSHRELSSRLSPHGSLIHLPDGKSLKQIFVSQHEPSRLANEVSELLPSIRPLERKPTREEGTIGVSFTRNDTPSIHSSMSLPHPEIPDATSTEAREGFMSLIISAAHHLTSSIAPHEKQLTQDANVSSSTILEENRSSPKATMAQYVQFQPIKESPINTLGNGDLSLASFGFGEDTERDDTNFKLILTPVASAERVLDFGAALAPQTSKTRRKPNILATLKPKRRPLSLSRTASLADRGTRELSPSAPQTPMEPALDAESESDGEKPNKRNAEFHQLFKTLPTSEKCTAAYGCALSKEILVHGKLYVSANHICFNSNILGWVTSLVIPLKKVVQIEKKSTALMFPNAMVIQTLHERHVFASFLSRDSSFDVLTETWRNAVQESGTRGGPGARRRSGTLSLALRSPTDLSGDDLDYDYSDNTDESTMESDEEMVKEDEPKASDPLPGTESGHAPTSLGYTKAPNDIEIVNDTLDAPLGAVFSYLFGDDVLNLRKVLEKQKNRDISLIPVFKKDSSGKKTRKYDYVKPLNGPIGPKQTKCEVTETIEKEDLDSSMMVLQSTRTPDVPSGGSFSVQTRFYLAWGENNGTKVFIVTSVEWTSKSWIKGAVENGSISGQKESLGVLVSELKVFAAANGKGRTKSKSKKRKSEEVEVEVVPVVTPPPLPPGFMSALDSLSAAIPLPIPDAAKIPVLLLVAYLLFSLFRRSSNVLSLGNTGMYQMEYKGRIYNLVPSVHDGRNEEYHAAGGELWDWVHDRGRAGYPRETWEKIGVKERMGKHSSRDIEEMIRLTQIRLDEIQRMI
ncbi:hypothetical protein BABINDRAFT_112432 [Babjeviella inositovora NRRL Y-12698]|uniref:VASt domain-containing protein n=1 Tax=Babjeviella inositovora NRRL Y-12698 TaxID=984486 RepID=A0A1E3QXS1_9ASCO|nr:uncharacterized protein BABINDRAFT_112432 [Babjeviella inositovora NRRL Y-12698]ODQ81862.1 hypothetical protein BABINDRAFT_112432 [Babjeviella inositovora NRRL Y-12698]